MNVKNVICNDFGVNVQRFNALGRSYAPRVVWWYGDSHFRAPEEYLRRMSEAYSNSAARSIPNTAAPLSNIGRILGINHFSAQYMEGLWEV